MSAPSFGELKKGLETVRHSVHLLLQKKRETEPDAVEVQAKREEAEEGAVAEQPAPAGETVGRAAAGAAGIVIPLADKEPPGRREAIASVARAAAALRKLDPYSPGPYLMMRGLRWGELRAAFHTSDMTLLEGPPTELRQHIKKLAIEGKVERTPGSGRKCDVASVQPRLARFAALRGRCLCGTGKRIRGDCYCHPFRTESITARPAADSWRPTCSMTLRLRIVRLRRG